jgi:TATA-binding protein-associated factor Taf7
MSVQLQQLETIEQNVKMLLEKTKKLNADNELLKQENELLKSNSVSQKEKITELENQLNVLKLAKSISSGTENDHNRAELKRKINEMVKEIDMCVGLLNN